MFESCFFVVELENSFKKLAWNYRTNQNSESESFSTNHDLAAYRDFPALYLPPDAGYMILLIWLLVVG